MGSVRVAPGINILSEVHLRKTPSIYVNQEFFGYSRFRLRSYFGLRYTHNRFAFQLALLNRIGFIIFSEAGERAVDAKIAYRL